MREKTRILILSTTPLTSTGIVVDDEAKEIFDRLQEGPYRDRFHLHNHAASRPSDLQKLLLTYEPHIVHFSENGSQLRRILLGGTQRYSPGDHQGLANVFALYNSHVRLVFLNSWFTEAQARSVSQVINYAVGSVKGIDDRVAVAFAGAFYRALGFGRSIRAAFESAKAELALTRTPQFQGFDLFVRHGVSERDRFPRTVKPARSRRQLVRRNHRAPRSTVSTRLRHVAPGDEGAAR